MGIDSRRSCTWNEATSSIAAAAAAATATRGTARFIVCLFEGGHVSSNMALFAVRGLNSCTSFACASTGSSIRANEIAE